MLIDILHCFFGNKVNIVAHNVIFQYTKSIVHFPFELKNTN